MKLTKTHLLFLSVLLSTGLYATDKKKVAATSTNVSRVVVSHTKSASHQIANVQNNQIEVELIDASNTKFIETQTQDLFEILNHNVNETIVQRTIASIKGDYELVNLGGNIFYIWRNEGLSFKFDNKSVLQQIQFFNGKEFLGSFCSIYKNNLPNYIQFAQNRNEIEAKIGKPIEVSNPTNDEKVFAKYNIEANSYQLLITYNTNSSADMNSNISDIILMKNSTEKYSSNSNINSNIVSNTTTTSIKEINSENIIVDQQNKDLKPLTLIGKNQNDAAVKSFVAENGKSNMQVVDFDQSSQYLIKDAGVILNFDNSKNVASVMLVNKNNELGSDIKQYQGNLPQGINFSLNRAEVEERLGTPVQTSTNTNSLYWVMYSINNGNDALYLTYNTKNVDLKSATISDIRVERLK